MLALIVGHPDLSGTLSVWVPVAIAGFVGYRITRGGGGTAVQELDRANKVLARRVHELDSQVRDLKAANAVLRQRTDFHAVLAEHERRAQERTDALLRVLDLVAVRLGPDDDHDGAAEHPSAREV